MTRPCLLSFVAVPSIRFPDQSKSRKMPATNRQNDVSHISYKQFVRGMDSGKTLDSTSLESSTEPRIDTGEDTNDSGIATADQEMIEKSGLTTEPSVSSGSTIAKSAAVCEKSFDVVSLAWQQKVREMETKMNAMEQQLERKDCDIKTLVAENRNLKQALAKNQETMADLSKVHDNHVIVKARKLLSSKFTKNQADLMLGVKSRVRWTNEELAQGFSLRYFGAPGHDFVTKTLQYPLPKLTCLKKHASRMDMRQGFLEDVLSMLKAKSVTMSEQEKVCVLIYDEMSCSEIYEYDKKHDDVLGPHSKMQVCRIWALWQRLLS